jgi:hypothetical protein
MTGNPKVEDQYPLTTRLYRWLTPGRVQLYAARSVLQGLRLAEVRHELVVKPPKSFKISSGWSR